MVDHGWHRRVAWIIVGLALGWGLMPGLLPPALNAGSASGLLLSQATPFQLTVQEGLLSLRAQEASLKEILEAIGRQLGIETVVQLPAEARVTTAFDHLSVAEALQTLRQHATIAYVVRGGGDAPGTITQLFASPKGGGTAPAPETTQAADPQAHERSADPERRGSEPGPKGFRFEFDPFQAIPQGR
jgi:hypothetical protein